MFVTLDVSRLSGWLNTDTPSLTGACRVEKREYEFNVARPARMVADGDVQGKGPTGDQANGTRVRTKNMYPMSMTLDVSRLSGWLNTDASCRVGHRGHIQYKAGRGGRAVRRTVTCRGRDQLGIGRMARAVRTENM